MGGRSKGTGNPAKDEEEIGNGFVFTGNVFMFLMEETQPTFYYTFIVCVFDGGKVLWGIRRASFFKPLKMIKIRLRK